MAERPDLDEDKGGKLIDPTRFRGMVGSLMYLSASRPDRMLTKPGSHDTRRSTSVEPISWDISACSRSSKKKKSTAILSLRKAEYIALSGCCAQILWMLILWNAEERDVVPPGDPTLDDIHPELKGWELFFRENLFCSHGKRNKVNACTAYMLFYLTIKRKFNFTSMFIYRMEEVKNKQDGPMQFSMLLTCLYNHILQTNPQAIVPLARFTFHEHVMDPLDISRNPSKGKGKEDCLFLGNLLFLFIVQR
ncbi:hypothetical protein Tco_0893283 [Tanacetum coccineum]|uniref:Uncharacterized protein n=1 Tax=Tanacetum coccineum TaxID=301880 RepID=A0ABQ5C8D7_9ASTR